MAELKINRCKVCTSPLKAGATKCGKCGAEHSIEAATVNPLRFTPEQVSLYRAEFEAQVRENPADVDALFAVGLTYLGLKNYELAYESLQKAVRRNPDNPDIYYYCALCFFRHRSVMNLDKNEMERIEEWLQTAVQMLPKRKYLILLMILRQGMGSMGLNIDNYKEMPADLLEKARVTQREEDELHEIEQHVVITDNTTRQLLAQLEQRETQRDDALAESLEAYNDICDYPTQRDGDFDWDRVESLADPDIRHDTLLTMYEPQKPQYESYPSVIGLMWRVVWRTFLCCILFVIAALVAEGKYSVTSDIEDPLPTVQQRLDSRVARAKENGKTPLKSELQEWQKIAEKDYNYDVSKAERYRSDYRTYAWFRTSADGEQGPVHLGTPSDEDMAKGSTVTLCGVRTGRDGTIGLCIYALVPVIWIIWMLATVISFVGRWRRTSRENSELKRNYREMLDFHNVRPTVQDYKMFCQRYVGPNTGLVPQGDMVQQALAEAGVSEEDVANGNGKIYFFACFLDIDGYDRPTSDADIVLGWMGIDVCVAMRDCIVYLSTKWDTTSAEPPTFSTNKKVMYDRISEFGRDNNAKVLKIMSDGELRAAVSFGWRKYPSLFRYQSVDKSDGLTYSRTRTSNFDEFEKSLLKMHSAYLKR